MYDLPLVKKIQANALVKTFTKSAVSLCGATNIHKQHLVKQRTSISVTRVMDLLVKNFTISQFPCH